MPTQQEGKKSAYCSRVQEEPPPAYEQAEVLCGKRNCAVDPRHHPGSGLNQSQTDDASRGKNFSWSWFLERRQRDGPLQGNLKARRRNEEILLQLWRVRTEDNGIHFSQNFSFPLLLWLVQSWSQEVCKTWEATYVSYSSRTCCRNAHKPLRNCFHKDASRWSLCLKL